jgi:hypothetical protein
MPAEVNFLYKEQYIQQVYLQHQVKCLAIVLRGENDNV